MLKLFFFTFRMKGKDEQSMKAVGFFQLFRYATCLEALMMVLGLGCAALHGITLPIMCVVFGQMTDSFVLSGQQLNLTGLGNFSTNLSSGCVAIPGIDIEASMSQHAYYFVALGAAVLLLGTFQVTLFLLTATRQTKRIREKYFHAVLHQPMAWFDTHPIGELNTRLTDDINTINDGLGDKICIFVQFFCTFLAGFIIGFIYGWKLTLVIMSVSPLLAASAAVWSKILATLTSKELSAYAKAGAVAEEILVAIRTVVAFNGQQKAAEKYEKNLITAKDFGVKKAVTTNVSMGLTQFFIFGAYALAFWYGTKLTMDDPVNYSIGKVIIVFFSVMIGAFSLGQGAPNLESVAKARGAAYSIYNTIDMPRPIDSSSEEGYKPDSVRGDIEFRNVHFSYPSRKDVKILQGMSLKVPHGKTIALVGASGCGKSTTIQLLQRFYDPEAGEGTHIELLSKKGVYYSLVMQQTAGRSADDEAADENVSEGESLDDLSDAEHSDDLMDVTTANGGFARSSLRRSISLRCKRSRSSSKSKSKRTNKAEKESVPDVPFSRILALNKSEWPYLLVGTLASFVGGGVYPAVAILFAKIIGVFSEPDPEVKRQKALMFSLLFLLVGAVAFLTFFFQGYMFGKSGEILTMRLRSQAFKAILRQDISWFDDHNNAVGVLTTKLATDASLVKGAAGSRLGLATNTICALVIAMIVAFFHSWQLTLMILACTPILTGANFIQMRAMAGHTSKDQSALEMSGRISTETVENFKTVVSLTKEDVFFRKFNDSLNKPYRSALCKAPIYGITFALAQAIPYFVNAAVFRFGSWLIAHCHTQFENVFLVFSVIVFAAMSIGQSSSFAPDFAKAKAAAGRILALLEKTPEIDIYSEAGDKPINFKGDIEFRDVHFFYPTRPNIKILQGLNVSVRQGQTLALVGGSGCGKSTSIQLLERFYNPAGGQVFADGMDTRGLNLAWLRSQLGLVSQEPILFDCTITENIQYGDNSRVVSQEEVVEAAISANIHNFISDLPEKYNTRVGDKGTQLSGGQKQRIAIARALVRKPKVLLLDEATSALDTESEKIVQKALDDARQGRTCIVIAHRLTTV
uniref:ATP-binding cassette, sub-family B (MDR/TAP), member 5 n=1 Tax=Astyanax mexicanus TaxID=7994 RepID=A0A8B9JY20_ASTMX